jgi:hypothetical protein
MSINNMNIIPEDLMHAVEQLNETELASFVSRVIALQAQRKAPSLSLAESALLQNINAPFPDAIQRRYDELIALRRTESLTPTEYAELLQLTDIVETFQAKRVEALAELAQLRGKTMRQVMADLGITWPENA